MYDDDNEDEKKHKTKSIVLSLILKKCTQHVHNVEVYCIPNHSYTFGEHEEVIEQVASFVEVALAGLSFQAKLYPIGNN